jgi:hypothetical protein
MDGATKKIGGIVASISARGCGGDEWARLMKSYALGLIAEDDRDYPRVAAHVAECEACRRYVNGLRGLAAILPPVALPLGPVATGHGVGILAHLEHLFRNGHGGGGVEALRTAGSGAAGGTGGAALASSLSAGTVAKGVAVLAAGVAAAVLAAHGGKAHHVVARRTPTAQTQTYAPPAPASASATVAGSRSSGSGAAVHHGARAHGRRHPTARRRAARAVRKAQRSSSTQPASSEFGIENARYSSPASSTSSAPVESSGSGRVGVHRFVALPVNVDRPLAGDIDQKTGQILHAPTLCDGLADTVPRLVVRRFEVDPVQPHAARKQPVPDRAKHNLLQRLVVGVRDRLRLLPGRLMI